MTWSEKLYRQTTVAAAPLMRTVLERSSRYRPLAGRFWMQPCSVPTGGIWFHACSLGEVNTARPLLRDAEKMWPDCPVLLSASTISGYTRAADLAGPDRTYWFPFDDPGSLSRFFDRAVPRVIALVETEIWPGFLAEAARRGIPVAVLNGRISDKALPRYRRFGALFRPAFAKLALVAAQNETYAERFCVLGVHESRVRVAGSLKFDAVTLEPDPDKQHHLRACLGLSGSGSGAVVVFGSTRPGDELLAADCIDALQEDFPEVCWVVAPRHVERADEIDRVLNRFKAVRLSALKSGKSGPGKVVLADTLGDLIGLYSLASVAVIGGSFFPGVEGHNPLESAALGVPTVYGPYMGNFPDAAAALERAGGSLRLAAPGQLKETLRRLLADPDERIRVGSRGRKAVLEGQGAVGRNLACLAEIISQKNREGQGR